MKEYTINKKANQKHFHCEIKVKDSKKRIIRGWASTRFEDRDGEIVDPEGIRESLPMFEKNPVVLWNHDYRKVIGKMLSGQVNETGFWVEAEIAKGTADSEEVWALIEQDMLRAFSIGFIAKEYDHKERKINKLELLEFSVVSIPANSQALFSVAKAFDLGTDLIEKQDERGLSRRFDLFMKEFSFFMELKTQGSLKQSYMVALDEKLKSYDALSKSEIEGDYFEQTEKLRSLELQIEILKLQAPDSAA